CRRWAGLGVAPPAPGRRLDADGAILITLAVLVFCTGSSVTFADFRGLRVASRQLVLVLAATTVILPVLAWLASRLVSGPALQGGVMAAGGAPGEGASVALTRLGGGGGGGGGGPADRLHLADRPVRRADPEPAWCPFGDVTARAAGHARVCGGRAPDRGLRDAHHRSVRRPRAPADRRAGNREPAGAALGNRQRT